MNRLIHVLFLSLLMSTASASAEGLPIPTGNVILTISGALGKSNSEQGAEFDLAMLLALKQTVINTKTPWTEGINKFEGPLLKDVFSYLNLTGDEISAIALNGYRIKIPMVDVNTYPIILALKHNDTLLTVRTKGPSWVIYPWSDHSELRNRTYYTRGIWQLQRLDIH